MAYIKATLRYANYDTGTVVYDVNDADGRFIGEIEGLNKVYRYWPVSTNRGSRSFTSYMDALESFHRYMDVGDREWLA